MSKISKIFTFLNRIVTITEDKSKGIFKYDLDNLFPQRLIRQIGESGTATNCIEALNQYSYAEGLTDKDKGNLLISETQTLNDLIEDVLQSNNYFAGVAVHVMRDVIHPNLPVNNS